MVAADAGNEVSGDVTALVQDWVHNPSLEYGLVLVPAGINIQIWSRESGLPETLEVTTAGGG